MGDINSPWNLLVFFFILGVTDPASISSDTTLGDLGLDSLMGVEVKQTLERDYDLSLTMKEVRHLTMNKLHEISSDSSNQVTEQTQDRAREAKVKDVKKSLVPVDVIKKLNDAEGEPALFIVHPIEGMQCVIEGMQCVCDVCVHEHCLI